MDHIINKILFKKYFIKYYIKYNILLIIIYHTSLTINIIL